MTHAAGDLNVSREALSGQIRTLEEHLEMRLFYRRHRGLAFTEAGQTLFNAVSNGLGIIRSTVKDLHDSKEQSQLSITTSSAFAGSWLSSRLPEFLRLNPMTDIRVVESDECLDLVNEDIALGIRYGLGNWPKLTSTHLFNEVTFPICSPAFLAAHPDIADVNNLANHPLLHLEGTAHEREDWPHFFENAGVHTPKPLVGLRFSNFSNNVRSAINGGGIALAWGHVVEDLLERGDLVNPIGKSYKTGRGFYLVQPKKTNLSLTATALKDWLIEQLKEP